MEYKLICIDLDGTLLDSRRRVNKKTIEVLQKVHDQGVHIVISTGRLYSDAEHFSNLIGVDSPIIASNGSVIKESGNRESIYQSTFDQDLLERILKVLKNYKIRPSVYTSCTMYHSKLRVFLALWLERLFGKNIKGTKLKYICSRKHFDQVLEKERGEIIKCEVFDFKPDRISAIKEELLKMDEIEAVSSIYFCVEITKKGVSKGHAIEILSKQYGIEREEIMAIGDSENDLTMIEYAKMGVAMGNASQLVKEKANYITDTNDRLGVAKAIEHLIAM